MSDVIELHSLRSWCKNIDDRIGEDYPRIHSAVAEVVEPSIENLPNDSSEPFDSMAQNLLANFHNGKELRTQALEVARRTTLVAHIVITQTLGTKPIYYAGPVLESFAQGGSYAPLLQELQNSGKTGENYNRLMTDCHPSIDPTAKEPEVFKMFSGFSFLALVSGEIKRQEDELSQAINSILTFEGDLSELLGE